MDDLIRTSSGIQATTPVPTLASGAQNITAYAWTGGLAGHPHPQDEADRTVLGSLPGDQLDIDIGRPNGLVVVTVTLTVTQTTFPHSTLEIGSQGTTSGWNGVQMVRHDANGDTETFIAGYPERLSSGFNFVILGSDYFDGTLGAPTREETIDPAEIGPGSLTYSGVAAFAPAGDTSLTFSFEQVILNETTDDLPPSEWHGVVLVLTGESS